MPAFRQPSFAGGELSPTLWGRTDLAKYGHGLRSARNFFISPHGAALNRPGTAYLGEVKDSSKKVRLVPFIYSDTQSYVLEFGNLYVRIWSYGVLVAEVVTPYLEADLPRLKFAQVGDVLALAHGSYTLRTLSRTSHAVWALATVSLDVPLGTDGLDTGSKYHPAACAVDSAGLVSGYPPAADATHPAKEWTYLVTQLCKNEASGRIYETRACTVTEKFNAYTPAISPPEHAGRLAIDRNLVAYFDNGFRLAIDWVDAGLGSGDTILQRMLYKGRGQAFGLIGTADFSGNGERFIDLGYEPDFLQPPPRGNNPFKVYATGGGTLLRTEDPRVVAYFQGRRILAGTDERPAFFWGSRTDDYANFDDHVPTLDDDAIEFELASRRREEIRGIASLDRMIVFTNSAVWTVGGAGGSPLTFASVDARVQEEIGSSWLDPIVIGNIALYVRTKGSGVRQVSYDLGRDALQGADLSLLSQHLFQGRTIVDWSYAEDPYSVVWAARDDGKLLSLTFNREHDLWAWTRHDTEDGAALVENVCCVPETTEDAVYLVVKRTVGGATKRYVERMATRIVSDVKEALFLDCAKSYDSAAATVFSGLGHLEGKTVYALCDGNAVGPLTVVAGAIDISADLPDGARRVHIGLAYLSELELLDLAEARTKHKTVTRVEVEVETSRGLWSGEDAAHLTEWKQRVVADSYGTVPLATVRVPLNISGRWNTGGRVVLQQQSPLPLAVLGVTREVEGGT